MSVEEGHSQREAVLIGGGKRKEAFSCEHSFFSEGNEISQRVRK